MLGKVRKESNKKSAKKTEPIRKGTTGSLVLMQCIDNFFPAGLNQSVTFWFRNFSVSKLFQFFGWYRIRYRKNLVSKKVSDSVSEKNWYQKKYRIRYHKYLVSKKVSDSVS